jgi:hypothetical protein
LTNFDNRVSILADLWLNFRKEEGLQDFIEYNDLALPFAFAISEGILVNDEPGVNRFIDERGFFEESWREEWFGIKFVQDNYAKSKAGVLRGMHYQRS